jgi:hypothetical protein
MNSLPDKTEAFRQARVELARADHLLFVSLKYTRTVDVIKNLIKRLLATYDFLWHTILMHDVEKGLLEDIPSLAIVKLEKIKELHPDDEMLTNFAKFYVLLKKLDKASFERKLEFRRHVAMIAELNGDIVHVTIDVISDYYHRTKELFKYIKEMIA